jgi:hypothetical protein
MCEYCARRNSDGERRRLSVVQGVVASPELTTTPDTDEAASAK